MRRLVSGVLGYSYVSSGSVPLVDFLDTKIDHHILVIAIIRNLYKKAKEMICMYLIGFLGCYFFVLFLSIFCFHFLDILCTCSSQILHTFFFYSYPTHIMHTSTHILQSDSARSDIVVV